MGVSCPGPQTPRARQEGGGFPGFLKLGDEARAWPTWQVVPCGQCWACPGRQPPRALLVASQRSDSGGLMPPVLTHVRPAGLGVGRGRPHSRLDLIRPGCVQRLDMGRASAPPLPQPWLGKARMSSWEPKARKDRQGGGPRGTRATARLGCPVGLPVGPLPAGTRLGTGYF